jgi:hypothetical protein
MKTYKIPVVWQMIGHVEVQADSLSEAIIDAEDAPLPEDGSYIEGSFEVDESSIEVDESSIEVDESSIEDYFTKGTSVNVTANDNDMFHDFTGIVKGYRNGNIIVQDQDDDCWEVEPNQISFCSDDNM